MKIKICSRRVVEKILSEKKFPEDMVLISFYTPSPGESAEQCRVNASSIGDRVFYVGIPDIDIECLDEYGYTYQTYLSEADELAKFIYKAKKEGRSILCQCDYGQSRSAGCAAAIAEHFFRRGIDIFADFRYYPNQVVFHKVYDALEAYKRLNTETHN